MDPYRSAEVADRSAEGARTPEGLPGGRVVSLGQRAIPSAQQGITGTELHMDAQGAQDTAERLRAIGDEVSDRFYERADVVRTLLAGQHTSHSMYVSEPGGVTREAWAKACALALLDQAREAKRDFVGILFSAADRIRVCRFPAGREAVSRRCSTSRRPSSAAAPATRRR